MRKFVLLGLFALAVTAWAGGYRYSKLFNENSAQSVDMAITPAGDTAQVSLLHTITAVDSFDYVDTFSYQPDTTAHQTIKWTSPVQSMIITPTVDVASVYACSIGFFEDTLGIAFDPSGTEATLDSLIDSLVAQLNAVAGLTDSVDFQDSVTYIKAVSLFGQRKFKTRWKCEFGVTGGTGTIDTASHASLVTIPTVIDSMVAAINADAGLDSFMTAANSGDTGYTITSDDAGVLFYATTLNHADTGGTLVASQANVATNSWNTDTIYLPPILTPSMSPASFYGRFIIKPSVTSTQGIGSSDSGYLVLYTQFADELKEIARDSAAALPCTLVASIVDVDSVGGIKVDTLLHYGLAVAATVMDTANDTTVTINYPLQVDYEVRD